LERKEKTDKSGKKREKKRERNVGKSPILNIQRILLLSQDHSVTIETETRERERIAAAALSYQRNERKETERDCEKESVFSLFPLPSLSSQCFGQLNADSGLRYAADGLHCGGGRSRGKRERGRGVKRRG
jgi:hypothetical protein